MRKVSQRPTLIPRAGRTLSRYRNPRFVQTRIQQLLSICLPEIQTHLVMRSTEQLIRIVKLSFKLRPHLFPDRVTTDPNAGPYRRHQILRPSPIFLPHLRDAAHHNFRYRPSPPSVESRYRSLLHIHHQYRHAICGPNSEQSSRHIRHQPITLQNRLSIRSLKPTLQCSVTLPDYPNHTRVNLPYSYQHGTIILPIDLRQEPPPIFRHRGSVILLGPSQIQRSSSIDQGNATPPCAEPMPKPSILFPFRNSYDIQAHSILANSFILRSSTTAAALLAHGNLILEPDVVRQPEGSSCNILRLLASTLGAFGEVRASKEI